MYAIDTDGFPESNLNPQELIYFRSWQGPGVTKIFYYASLFFLVFQAIMHVIMLSGWMGWKGFLVSSVSGVVIVVVGAIGLRILCEVIMAIFSIRESLAEGKPAQDKRSLSGEGFSFSKENPFDKETPNTYQQV